MDSVTESNIEEVEVSFEEAAQEQPTIPEVEANSEKDVLDIIVPKKEPKTWKFGPNGEFEFVQRELSFVAKLQWFSLVGEVLDKALSGEGAMSLNSLFDAPGARGGQMTMQDFADADTFVQAIGKLLVYAPDFLTKSYCIWLNVPDYQRDLVSDLMSRSPDEGGLTDDQGIEIIEIFIDQNYEALDRFFREKIGGLQKRVQARIEASQSSRPSRR